MSSSGACWVDKGNIPDMFFSYYFQFLLSLKIQRNKGRNNTQQGMIVKYFLEASDCEQIQNI